MRNRKAAPLSAMVMREVRRRTGKTNAQQIVRWAVLFMIVVSFALTFNFVDSGAGEAGALAARGGDVDADAPEDDAADAGGRSGRLPEEDADDGDGGEEGADGDADGEAGADEDADGEEDGEEDADADADADADGDEQEDEDGAPRAARRRRDRDADGDEEDDGEEDVEPEVVTIQPFHGAAAGGTVITVRGKHLMGDEVRAEVGGVSCQSTSVTDEETLLCTAPAGAGARLNVGVRKRTSRGYFVTSRENTLFSYDDPAVESVTPDHGPTEGGSTISIVGVNFGPLDSGVAVEASVGGVPCKTTTAVSDSVVVCVTPEGTPGAKSVVVAVGEGEHRTESRRNRLFAYVLSPRERLLEQAGALLDGLTVRFGASVPNTLHRTGTTAPFEFTSKDAFTGKSITFAVSPDVFETLPDTDWRKDYRRCAVVGHDRSLLDTLHGRRIDSADAVFRFNNAPTKGYEEHVGTRADVRMLSTAFLRMVLTRDPHVRRAGMAAGGPAGWRPSNKQTLVISSPFAMELGVQLSKAFPRANVLHLSRALIANVRTLYRELRRRFEELGVEGMLTKSSALEAQEAFAGGGLVEEDSDGTPQDRSDSRGSGDGDGDGLPESEEGWGGNRKLLVKPASLQVSETLAKMALEAQALADVEPAPSAFDPLPEFIGVLLALQTCRTVELFGMPRALDASAMRSGGAKLSEEPRSGMNSGMREPYFTREGAIIFDTRDGSLADRSATGDASSLDIDAAILQLLELRGYVTIVD